MTQPPVARAAERLEGAHLDHVRRLDLRDDQLRDPVPRLYLSVKVTGLAQKLGQLEAVNREFQSKILGQLATFGPTL
jgi:hypothetical protein